jgi:hypothetical protein
MWSAFIWLNIGSTSDSCEHETESSGRLKWWKFLNKLSNYLLLDKESAQFS